MTKTAGGGQGIEKRGDNWFYDEERSAFLHQCHGIGEPTVILVERRNSIKTYYCKKCDGSVNFPITFKELGLE